MSPYQLVYGKTYHLPEELEFKAHWTIRRWNMDFEAAGVKRKMQLFELDEWQEQAYHNSKIYKERTKIWHDKRIKKKFALEDKVLLLILGLNYSGTENFEASGKDHLWW
jgi:hypothetical protein